MDGASESFPESGEPSATATLTFSGLGAHSASCEADNTAQATDGSHAWSPVATGDLSVRMPTAALASFSKLVDKKVCHAVVSKVMVPAGWHEIHWHGHKVRARLPAHKVRRRVRQCRARLAKRQIVVFQTVRRHGHRIRIKRHRIIEVPIQPHTITKGIRTVRFGRTATLRGTLEATDGQALASQTVTVLGLPRNTHSDFKPLVTTTTNADGAWQATIPRGPGRILEATYGGAPTTEPATSDQVRTIVHARVKLSRITPQRVPWAGRITLRGKLPGGHIPHRGVNVRLVYGLGHHSTTYAVRQHVGARKSEDFRAHFRFGAGPAHARARFFFEVCTLPSPGYPFAVGCSAKRYVRVGGHPQARDSKKAAKELSKHTGQ